MKRFLAICAVVAITAMVALLSGCGGSRASGARPVVRGSGAGGRSVASQMSPSGDIPDSQVFVTFTSAPGGYSLEVPEGWARSMNGPNVRFAFDYDGLSVRIIRAGSAADTAAADASKARAFATGGKPLSDIQVKNVTVSGRNVVLVRYQSSSAANAVTNKRVRLDNNLYVFSHNGWLAVLRLWAPVGADNVDQWKRISSSFAWR